MARTDLFVGVLRAKQLQNIDDNFDVLFTSYATKTDDYEAVEADDGTTILMDKGTAQTLTLPDAADLAIGWKIHAVQTGAGTLTVAKQGSDTLTTAGSAATARAQHSLVTIELIGATTFLLSGDVTVA